MAKSARARETALLASGSLGSNVPEFEKVVRRLGSFRLRVRFWHRAWKRPGAEEFREAVIAAYALGGVAALTAMGEQLEAL